MGLIVGSQAVFMPQLHGGKKSVAWSKKKKKTKEENEAVLNDSEAKKNRVLNKQKEKLRNEQKTLRKKYPTFSWFDFPETCSREVFEKCLWQLRDILVCKQEALGLLIDALETRQKIAMTINQVILSDHRFQQKRLAVKVKCTEYARIFDSVEKFFLSSEEISRQPDWLCRAEWFKKKVQGQVGVLLTDSEKQFLETLKKNENTQGLLQISTVTLADLYRASKLFERQKQDQVRFFLTYEESNFLERLESGATTEFLRIMAHDLLIAEKISRSVRNSNWAKSVLIHAVVDALDKLPLSKKAEERHILYLVADLEILAHNEFDLNLLIPMTESVKQLNKCDNKLFEKIEKDLASLSPEKSHILSVTSAYFNDKTAETTESSKNKLAELLAFLALKKDLFEIVRVLAERDHHRTYSVLSSDSFDADKESTLPNVREMDRCFVCGGFDREQAFRAMVDNVIRPGDKNFDLDDETIKSLKKLIRSDGATRREVLLAQALLKNVRLSHLERECERTYEPRMRAFDFRSFFGCLEQLSGALSDKGKKRFVADSIPVIGCYTGYNTPLHPYQTIRDQQKLIDEVQGLANKL